jgi:hypothetical protein
MEVIIDVNELENDFEENMMSYTFDDDDHDEGGIQDNVMIEDVIL